MSLSIITGCMFSGKTSNLINTFNVLIANNKKVILINSKLDDRYLKDSICTHDNKSIQCISVNKLSDIDPIKYIESSHIIIDEAHFFPDLYNFVINAIDDDKKHITIAGLNGDSDKQNLGQINLLYPHADGIKLLKATCSICDNGTSAIFSKKIKKNDLQIDIGSDDKYMSVCRTCYTK